jgi:hypothetical protein
MWTWLWPLAFTIVALAWALPERPSQGGYFGDAFAMMSRLIGAAFASLFGWFVWALLT